MQRSDTLFHDSHRPTDEFSPQAVLVALPQSQPCLVQLSGLGTGRLFYLPTRDGTFEIGRSEKADLCLPYPEVALQHVRIHVEAGKIKIENLHHPQSVRLQGQSVAPHQLLAHGDRLRIGPYLTFKFLQLKEDEVACQEQLYRSSSHDPLTQLANARHFQDLLEQEWSYAKRHQQALSVLCVDIDQFRQYNETYGFTEGDRLLCQVSERLQQSIRREDTLARVGADGFAILLRETPHVGALQVAERIRQTFAHTSFSRDQAHFSPTLSMGMASTIPPASAAPLSLLHAAHEQLHHAQRQGGDQLSFDASRIAALHAEALS